MIHEIVQGREFLVCSKPQGTGCDHFQWADEAGSDGFTNATGTNHVQWARGGRQVTNNSPAMRVRQ